MTPGSFSVAPGAKPHTDADKATAARANAAEEAMRAFQKATKERRRAVLIAFPTGLFREGEAVPDKSVDVTEDVVSVMDRLTTTLDWGSGMFDDDDLAAFVRLADLLKIDVPEGLRQ